MNIREPERRVRNPNQQAQKRKQLGRNPSGSPPNSRSTNFLGMAFPPIHLQPTVRVKFA
ncbi:hypothetical protein C346_00014 [Cryptococcus neoformans D17-1]|nr:hypothetical protein C346_00014 [Cryptococcus neoformans var. grubii D17-1]